VVYGGLIACLFDCHCIGTAIAAAYDAEGRQPGSEPSIMYVTANLNVNYLRPAPMDRELLLKAHIVETKGKKTTVACELTADGTECANASVIGIRVA
jgi:acyl-coenzyme A thioesterase PaaI-like protein